MQCGADGSGSEQSVGKSGGERQLGEAGKGYRIRGFWVLRIGFSLDFGFWNLDFGFCINSDVGFSEPIFVGWWEMGDPFLAVTPSEATDLISLSPAFLPFCLSAFLPSCLFDLLTTEQRS